MNETQSSESQPAEIVAPGQHEAPIGFFTVGIVINVVLLGAYFVWAFKQWKKPGSNDQS